MEELYKKVMALDDDELERLESEERELLCSLDATKLHEFDNVAFGKDGARFALEDIERGDELIINGVIAQRADAAARRGERLD